MNFDRLRNCFEEVAVISRIGGAGPTPTRETVYHQIKIIRSEALELKDDGFAKMDRQEIRDGIADVLFTVAGGYARFDIPLPRDFEPVRLSNTAEAEQMVCKILGVLDTMEILASKNLMDYYVVMGILLKDIAEKAISIATHYGLPYEYDLEMVCASQWSKFDNNPEDAALTVARYAENGVEVYQEVRYLDGEQASAIATSYIVTHSAKDQNDLKGRPIPKGKWLKSVNFKEPEFVDVVWLNDDTLPN